MWIFHHSDAIFHVHTEFLPSYYHLLLSPAQSYSAFWKNLTCDFHLCNSLEPKIWFLRIGMIISTRSHCSTEWVEGQFWVDIKFRFTVSHIASATTMPWMQRCCKETCWLPCSGKLLQYLDTSVLHSWPCVLIDLFSHESYNPPIHTHKQVHPNITLHLHSQ